MVEPECLVCGIDIDPIIAMNNTGRPNCCDNCSIERREEYLIREKEVTPCNA